MACIRTMPTGSFFFRVRISAGRYRTLSTYTQLRGIALGRVREKGKFFLSDEEEIFASSAKILRRYYLLLLSDFLRERRLGQVGFTSSIYISTMMGLFFQ